MFHLPYLRASRAIVVRDYDLERVLYPVRCFLLRSARLSLPLPSPPLPIHSLPSARPHSVSSATFMIMMMMMVVMMTIFIFSPVCGVISLIIFCPFIYLRLDWEVSHSVSQSVCQSNSPPLEHSSQKVGAERERGPTTTITVTAYWSIIVLLYEYLASPD